MLKRKNIKDFRLTVIEDYKSLNKNEHFLLCHIEDILADADHCMSIDELKNYIWDYSREFPVHYNFSTLTRFITENWIWGRIDNGIKIEDKLSIIGTKNRPFIQISSTRFKREVLNIAYSSLEKEFKGSKSVFKKVIKAIFTIPFVEKKFIDFTGFIIKELEDDKETSKEIKSFLIETGVLEKVHTTSHYSNGELQAYPNNKLKTYITEGKHPHPTTGDIYETSPKFKFGGEKCRLIKRVTFPKNSFKFDIAVDKELQLKMLNLIMDRSDFKTHKEILTTIFFLTEEKAQEQVEWLNE